MSRISHQLRVGGLVACLGGAVLHADVSIPPSAEPGVRNVPITRGGKVTYVQVKDAKNPFRNLKDSGERNPDHFSFNQSSPMAHQSYDTGNTASSHDTDDYQKRTERTFETKSYFDRGAGNAYQSTANEHKSVAMNSAEGYSTRSSGFDRTFLTAKADGLDQHQAAESGSVSSYQNKSALLGGHDVKTFSSDMSSKTFEGREAEATKRDLQQMNEGLEGIKDLPNRALTIDEVRALINHGVKPETKGPPPVPSKALNDPHYQPEAAPAPLKIKPGEDHHLIDDNDIIPSPGMMAHPSGSAEPADSDTLPQ